MSCSDTLPAGMPAVCSQLGVARPNLLRIEAAVDSFWKSVKFCLDFFLHPVQFHWIILTSLVLYMRSFLASMLCLSARCLVLILRAIAYGVPTYPDGTPW